MQSHDEKIILEYLGGRDEAFEELASIYLPRIYNFIFRLVGNAADAEDITQETFFKTWKSLRKYKMGNSFKAWIFRIAHNTAIDKLRHKKDLAFSDFENEDGENRLTEGLQDEAFLPSELTSQVLQNEVLGELLARLSGSDREVLILHYHQDFTFEEIGKILDFSINTVKSRHHRALATLRKLIMNAPKLLVHPY